MQVQVQINASAGAKQCFFPGHDKCSSPVLAAGPWKPCFQLSLGLQVYEVDVELQVILAVLSDNLLSCYYGAKCACHTASGLPSFLGLTQGLRKKVYALYEVIASVH